MKYILIIIIGLNILLVESYLTKKRITDKEKLNLSGNVNAFDQFTYEAVTIDGKIEKGKKGFNDFRSGDFMDQIIGFNKSGYTVDKEVVLTSGKIHWKWQFKYNQKDQITEEFEYDNSGNLKHTIFEYNEQDEKIKSFQIFEQDTIIIESYNYDQNSNLKEQNFYKDGKISSKMNFEYLFKDSILEKKVYNPQKKYYQVFKYDNKENLIEYQYIHTNNGEIGKIVKEFFKYDKNNNKIEVNRRVNDGPTVFKSTKEYDIRNNITEEKLFDIKGKLYKKTSFVYEYDDHKNWIRRVGYLNDIPKIITERKYIYFN